MQLSNEIFVHGWIRLECANRIHAHNLAEMREDARLIEQSSNRGLGSIRASGNRVSSRRESIKRRGDVRIGRQLEIIRQQLSLCFLGQRDSKLRADKAKRLRRALVKVSIFLHETAAK